jgi:hypothetical protein
MNAQHLPKSIRRWMGDSVGHWEGDTLVVDTTNFNDKTHFSGSTENLHVIERFTCVDDKTLLYRFTVKDPDTWDQPWTGEYTWPATDKPIYEYACHEGNYALGSRGSGGASQKIMAKELRARARRLKARSHAIRRRVQAGFRAAGPFHQAQRGINECAARFSRRLWQPQPTKSQRL